MIGRFYDNLLFYSFYLKTYPSFPFPTKPSLPHIPLSTMLTHPDMFSKLKCKILTWIMWRYISAIHIYVKNQQSLKDWPAY